MVADNMLLVSEAEQHVWQEYPRVCAWDLEQRGWTQKDISEITETLEPLLEQLTLHAEKGEYSVLISDETSGRIPTLMIRMFLNEMYRRNNSPPVEALFLLGVSSEKERDEATKEELKRRMRQVQERFPEKKALVVTERIRGGWHIGEISDLLDEMGIAHDVAALRIDKEPEQIQYNRKVSGYKPIAPRGAIFYGKIGTGIRTGRVESDAIKGVRREIYTIAAIREPELRPMINATREQAKVVAKDLTEHIKNSHPVHRRTIMSKIGGLLRLLGPA